MTNAIHYRHRSVAGLDLFYREAGPATAPTIVLLHGFPTSSHMFRDLIPLLADRYHLIAPDYPGFGYSSTPSPREFAYTFDNLAGVMDALLEELKLGRYALYLQDFGGPVGFRIARRHPERVTALIIQNANVYEDGITQVLRDVVLPPYRKRTPQGDAALNTFFERPITLKQYLDGVPDTSLVSPDAYEHAQWGMDRPGNKVIQLELHANYGSNLEHYGEWQRYLREHTPPTLVTWGRRGRGLPARCAERRDPLARRRPFRAGDARRRDRPAHARLPRTRRRLSFVRIGHSPSRGPCLDCALRR